MNQQSQNRNRNQEQLEQELQPVAQMTLEECLAELSGEASVNRLRALVAARRMLIEMMEHDLSGNLELAVQQGVVRRVQRPDYLRLG